MLKIVQLIPAPPNLSVRYTDDNGSHRSTPAICLALVEKDSGQVIIPVTMQTFNIARGAIDKAALTSYDGVEFWAR